MGKLNKWQFFNLLFPFGCGYSFVGFTWHIQSMLSVQIHFWFNPEGTRNLNEVHVQVTHAHISHQRLGLPNQIDFARVHSSSGQCLAQYKEWEKQIMCNPLTKAKPTHHLWKSTSWGYLGALIHLIKHVWRQNQICLKALGTRAITKLNHISND